MRLQEQLPCTAKTPSKITVYAESAGLPIAILADPSLRRLAQRRAPYHEWGRSLARRQK
jgi:hypothetical protein